MYQFITIPKEYASDYRNRLINKQEREMLVWLRMLASPYGIAVADLDSLANDCFSRGTDKNYANKVLLSLKRKRYIYYKERAGCRGSFEVHLDWWLLPNKGKTGLPAIKRITGLLDGEDSVRGDDVTDTLGTSEVQTEVEGQKQRSEDTKDAIDALDNIFSTNPPFRGSYTDTEKEKENETNRSDSFNKEFRSINTRTRGDFSVKRFYPENQTEILLLEIARELGEPDMHFLLGSKVKHGMAIIESVYKECKNSGAWNAVENRGALFNATLQRLINRKNP